MASKLPESPLLKEENYGSGKKARERDNDLMRRNPPSKLRTLGRQSKNVRDMRSVTGNPEMTDVSMSISSPERMERRRAQQSEYNQRQLSAEHPEADPRMARTRHLNKMSVLGSSPSPDRGTSRFSKQNLPQKQSTGLYRSIGSYLEPSPSRFAASMAPPPVKPSRRASVQPAHPAIKSPAGLRDIQEKSMSRLNEVDKKLTSKPSRSEAVRKKKKKK